MCILYCILQIRMLLRCAALAAVSGYGGVPWASRGSGSAKIGLKRFMILTPVSIMRILFCRKLGEYQKPRKIITKYEMKCTTSLLVLINGDCADFYFLATGSNEMAVFSPALAKFHVLTRA